MFFLHGFTGSPESLGPVQRLAPDFVEWIAPPLLGHGGPLAARTFSEECARLVQVIPPGSRCLAYSLGARLALSIACDDPERFSELILVGVHPGLESESARSERRAQDEERAARIEAEGVRAFVDEWETLSLFQEDVLPEDIRAKRRRIRLGHSAAGLAAALRRLGLGSMPSTWDLLPALPISVTFVAGELDAKFRTLAARAAERVPEGRVVVIPGAGHDVILSHPGAIAALVAPTAEAVQ